MNLPELPKSAVFVGAGVIAFEFAHVLIRAGVEVTLLEVGARPLANFDKEAVAALVGATETLGVQIYTQVRVESIEAAAQGFTVRATVDGVERSFDAEQVFHGAGRVPNTDGLELERAGVEVEGRRIHVDAYLRSTTQPHIRFAGDILSGVPQLSPVATTEGKLIGNNLVQQLAQGGDADELQPSYDALPAAVFTIPALAQVGLTEAAAQAKGHTVRTKVLRLDVVAQLPDLRRANCICQSRL